MNKKFLRILVMVIIILSLSLSACTRKATNAPSEEKAAEADSPIGPVATQPDAISEAAQSTEQAMQESSDAEAAPEEDENVGGGAPEVEPATATPEPTADKEDFKEPDRPETYTLKKGEFPYCIARRYNLDIASLLNANGLGVNSQVSPGTTLTIPQSGTWGSGSRTLRNHPDTFTVRSGDTVYSIACLYGDVYPEEIIYLNDLDSSGTITAGQQLQIP